MKKIFLIILSVFLLACQSAPVAYEFEDSEVYKYDLNGIPYYFSYPATAYLKDNEYLTFEACQVHFGTEKPEAESILEVNSKGGYEVWFKDNTLVAYIAELDGFFFYVEGEDVSGCVELVETIAASFTDKLTYENKRFDFRMIIPSDYKVNYLDDDAGLIFSKWMDIEIDPDDYDEDEEPETRYKVEMVVLPFENIEDYKHISEYIAVQYSGYTLQFTEYDRVSGFYVDEGIGQDAIRHFFTLNRDGDAIVEAYLQLKSSFYNEHKEEFETLVSTIELF